PAGLVGPRQTFARQRQCGRAALWVRSVVRRRMESARAARQALPKAGARAGRQCQSFGKRSRPYLSQVIPVDPIAGAIFPFSENATLVPLALRQRDNRYD